MFFSVYLNSSLLSDTLKEQDYMTETLQKMEENRDENKKLLKQKKSLIIKQISAAKSKVLKYLDDIEERFSNSMSISLIADVMS
jgi:restriction endonuclease S subunit